VTDPPAQLAVRVDGEDIAGKLKQPIAVDPGEHVVLASAPGYREWRTTAKVAAASAEVRVAIELDKIEAPVRAPAATAVVEYRRHRLGHRTAAKICLLGGLAAWTASLSIGIYEKGKYDEAIDRINNGPGTPQENVEAANHAQTVNRWVATPLFAAGLVSVAVGAGLWVQSSTVVLTPIASPTGGGVALSGTF
jgi:hypothetical protein